MQVSNATAAYLAPAAPVKAVAQVRASTGAETTESAAPAERPLVSNGLVNWSSLITPETLSSMFALNADGSVKTDAQGQPQMSASHQGPWSGTESLIAMRVRGQAMESLGVDRNLASHVTDAQKQLFHAVTGYNLVTEGSWSMVMDDAGNQVADTTGPQGGLCGAAYQLAGRLQSDSMDGAVHPEMNADWFANWSSEMGAAGVGLPPEWAARAKGYFNHALDALFQKDPESELDDTHSPPSAMEAGAASAAYTRLDAEASG